MKVDEILKGEGQKETDLGMPISLARLINHLGHPTSGGEKKGSRSIKLVVLFPHKRKNKD